MKKRLFLSFIIIIFLLSVIPAPGLAGIYKNNKIFNSCAGNDCATFVSQNVPTTMVAGELYDVSVTMRNTGQTAWQEIPPGPYRLGSEFKWNYYGRALIENGVKIQPGQTYAFNFKIQAPANPGKYNFKWRMLRENIHWFGDYTANLIIQVKQAPSQSSMRWDLASFPFQGLFAGGQSMTYNPLNHKIYVYGGLNFADPRKSVMNRMGIYDIAADKWTQTGDNSWLPLTDHASIYNPKDKKIYILFGAISGGGAGEINDIYIYNPQDDSMTKMPDPADGIKPPTRSLTPAAFDVQGQKIYIYGGDDGTLVQPRNDFWVYNIQQNKWTELPPIPVSYGRMMHATAFDPIHKRVYIIAGTTDASPHTGEPTPLGDLWYFDIATSNWTQLDDIDSVLGKRMGLQGFYNVAAKKITVFGGSNLETIFEYDAIWELNTVSHEWEKTQTGGEIRENHFRYSMAWDEQRQKIYIYGGGVISYYYILVMEMRAYDYETNLWNKISFKVRQKEGGAGSDYPFDFEGGGITGVLAPEQNTFFMFGGYSNYPGNALWAYNPKDNAVIRPKTYGQAPSERRWTRMVWNDNDKNIYLFGGTPDIETDYFYKFNPQNMTWTEITDATGSMPTSRMGHTMAYNPRDKKIYVYGGVWSGDDLYTYDSRTNHWEVIQPDGDKPHPRIWHTAIWDTIRNKMLVFGGAYQDNIPPYWHYLNDLWEYDPIANKWAQINTTTSDAPPATATHAAVWDPINNLMIVIGNGLENPYRYSPALRAWQRIPIASQYNLLTDETYFDTLAFWDTTKQRAIAYSASKIDPDFTKRSFWILSYTYTDIK